MAEIRHLNNAPVIEAILVFQADASRYWDPTKIRAELASHFPNFPHVQELRNFEGQITFGPEQEPETSTKLHPVEAFILRDEKNEIALQIRRDGFAFSHLPLYPGWDRFVQLALEQWEKFKNFLGVSEPFTISVRFISRVSYPLDGFKLSRYFEDYPTAPKDSGWTFGFFHEHHVYSPPDNKFLITSVFSRVPAENSNGKIDFILDLSAAPAQPLAESGNSIESLLPELRDLKNAAFFSKFTEEGLEPYS